jgi:hypothetical protein
VRAVYFVYAGDGKVAMWHQWSFWFAAGLIIGSSAARGQQLEYTVL